MSVPQGVSPARANSDNAKVLVHPYGWLALVGLGFGFTTWAAFLFIGIRAGRRAWLAWAAVYAILLAASLVPAGPNPSPAESLAAGLALLTAWLGGTAHAALVRKDFAPRGRLAGGTGKLAAARQRVKRRAKGQRLAARNPSLAREVGVGRPDLPEAEDYGLVDVNHASRDALCRLPGITPETASRIVDTRVDVGSFKSADDLGMCLDMAPYLIDQVREFAVFL